MNIEIEKFFKKNRGIYSVLYDKRNNLRGEVTNKIDKLITFLPKNRVNLCAETKNKDDFHYSLAISNRGIWCKYSYDNTYEDYNLFDGKGLVADNNGRERINKIRDKTAKRIINFLLTIQKKEIEVNFELSKDISLYTNLSGLINYKRYSNVDIYLKHKEKIIDIINKCYEKMSEDIKYFDELNKKIELNFKDELQVVLMKERLKDGTI
jgi:hypothetical protein